MTDSSTKGACAGIRSLLEKAAIYGLGIGASRLLNLIVLPLLVGSLSTEQYGIVTVLTLVGVALRVVLGFGLSAGLGIVWFELLEGSRRYSLIWSACIVLGLAGTLGVAAAAVAPAPLSRLLLTVPGYGFETFLYVLSVAIQIAVEPLLVQFQLAGRAGRYAACSVAGTGSGLVLGAVLVVWGGLGVFGWVIGVFAGSVLLALFLVGDAIARFGRPCFDPAMVRRVLAVGIPLVPGSLALIAMTNASPLLLAHFRGLDEVGIFGVAFQIGMGMTLFTAAFSSAWMPLFQSYKNRQDDATAFFQVCSSFYLIAFGALTLAFFALAEPVIEAWLHPSFHSAHAQVGIIAASQAVVGLWGMLLPPMYFARETGWVSLVQMIAASATVIAQFALVPRYGAMGAASGLLVGALVLVATQLVVNWARCYPVRPLRFPSATLLIVVTGGAAWSVRNAAVSGLSTDAIVFILVSFAVFATVSAVTLVLGRGWRTFFRMFTTEHS